MERKYMDRREFLKWMATITGGTLGGAALAGCVVPTAAPQVVKETVVVEKEVQVTAAPTQPIYMGTVIRTLSNEYHAAWYRGGRIFAESVGQGPYHRGLHCEGDSEKQITLMKALIQEGGQNVIFNIDPNQSPDARAIADLCAENKVYFLTQWNKPDDLHPWDYDPYWTAHMGVDGVPSGYYVAKELFKAMGGQGQIVALQGLLANVPAIQRFDGLKKALEESPDIELMEDQTAEWDRTKAVSVTEAFLAKYPDVAGIWAANDNMGLGALEALRTAGLAGKVPVVGIDGTSEAINACIAGEFAATVNNDPMWQGGMGLSIPYHALMGKFDPAAEPQEHREFYFEPVYVNLENAAQIKQDYIDGIPNYDWEDLWGRVQTA
jgi:ribose transport system substrate-binding protein